MGTERGKRRGRGLRWKDVGVQGIEGTPEMSVAAQERSMLRRQSKE
jgi:hypothetical protein